MIYEFMKPLKTYRLFTLVIIISSVTANKVFCEQSDTLTLTVKTYDGLELPAQVIKSNKQDKKMILFINGSTPYDEKGNLGAFWTDEGKIVRERHDFYVRFLDIM